MKVKASVCCSTRYCRLTTPSTALVSVRTVAYQSGTLTSSAYSGLVAVKSHFCTFQSRPASLMASWLVTALSMTVPSPCHGGSPVTNTAALPVLWSIMCRRTRPRISATSRMGRSFRGREYNNDKQGMQKADRAQSAVHVPSDLSVAGQGAYHAASEPL